MADWVIGIFLALGTLGYLTFGLSPYTFDFDNPSRPQLIYITPLNGFLNWACFVPFGVLIAQLSFVEHPILLAGLFCGVLSFIVESLQLFLPKRFSTVSDWLLNTSGGLCGAAFAIYLGT